MLTNCRSCLLKLGTAAFSQGLFQHPVTRQQEAESTPSSWIHVGLSNSPDQYHQAEIMLHQLKCQVRKAGMASARSQSSGTLPLKYCHCAMSKSKPTHMEKPHGGVHVERNQGFPGPVPASTGRARHVRTSLQSLSLDTSKCSDLELFSWGIRLWHKDKSSFYCYPG